MGEEAEVLVYDPTTLTWSKFAEFATAQWLSENIRLRTDASIQPFGLNEDEIPIPGAIYEQITFRQKSVRDDLTTMFPLGGESSSVSEFVFYVKKDIYDQASTGWKAILTAN